jgi:hypothetical protein
MVRLLQEGPPPPQEPVAGHPGADLHDRKDDDDPVGDDLMAEIVPIDGLVLAGVVGGRVGGVEIRMALSEGLFRTTYTTADRTRVSMAGTMKMKYHGHECRIWPPSPQAMKYPSARTEFQTPVNTPRSRTWNQAELTFETATAQKDWKY